MEAGCQLYESLTFRMRPAAIALNYRVTNIQNDVRQIIINIYIEKMQFNSLVWGSLLLAPNMYGIWDVMPGVPWKACWGEFSTANAET